LKRADLTYEGASSSSSSSMSSVAADGGGIGRERDDVVLWWADDDLIVSARLDTDGNASTRDATDLVGRGIYRPPSPTSSSSSSSSSRSTPSSGDAYDASVVHIELRGRGMFGMSVTARK
jgi:hypothetical protein